VIRVVRRIALWALWALLIAILTAAAVCMNSPQRPPEAVPFKLSGGPTPVALADGTWRMAWQIAGTKSAQVCVAWPERVPTPSGMAGSG